ncbi:MAG: hypothetical protein IPM64_12400 [Phycisphaerales bacterium]|nr:hypothetical protein [Phycisphaerales bacterium]
MILFAQTRHTVLFVVTALLAAAPATAQAQLGRIEVGRPFPDERFQALKDGRPTSLSDSHGKRVLLLVFASW